MNQMNSGFDEKLSFPMTRRRLLGYAAGVAATTLASTFLPPNLRRALAQSAPSSSFHDIEHVVLLMQENRSFDHYFGTMAGVRGFSDPNALQLDGGKSVFYQPDPESPEGYLLPFHLDTTSSNAQKLPSTNHGWEAQHESWNGGKMDNWVPTHRRVDKEKGSFVMGHFTRADIPFHFALAEAFTICDSYQLFRPGAHQPEPPLLDDGDQSSARNGKRGHDHQHASARGKPVEDLPGTSRGGRRQLEGLSSGGKISPQEQALLGTMKIRLQRAGGLSPVRECRSRFAAL